MAEFYKITMEKIHGLIEKAARIAERAHKKQTRKESGLPYIAHPFSVALKLAKYSFSDVVVAAALAHDVVEDSDVSEKKLREELGDEAVDIVMSVSNDDSLPWDEKKKKYIETVRNGSEGAKAVATADKIHNLESLLIAYKEQGPRVWENFNAGMEKKIWFEDAMLAMLKETWKHPLIDEYGDLLAELKELLR